MKTCLVIGLGQFGAAVAKTLCTLDWEVAAVDREKPRVRSIADAVSLAVTGDAVQEELLAALDAGRYDCAVVSFSGDFGDRVPLTMSLKNMGVRQVLCRADDPRQGQALLQIGADRILLPEQESGEWLARELAKEQECIG